MPEHVFTIAAKAIAVDASTNVLSVFQVIEQFNASQFPIGLPGGFRIVTLWRRLAGEEGISFVQRTKLVDPNEEEIIHADSSFTLQKVRHRLLGTIGGVLFKLAGHHRIEILVRKEDDTEWSLAHSYPIQVELLSAPSANAP